MCARRIGSESGWESRVRRGKKTKKTTVRRVRTPIYARMCIPACYVSSPRVLKIVLLLLLLSRGCPRWLGGGDLVNTAAVVEKTFGAGTPEQPSGWLSYKTAAAEKKKTVINTARRRFSHEPKACSPPLVGRFLRRGFCFLAAFVIFRSPPARTGFLCTPFLPA